MRKIISYIATSLDGKIADSEGGVDWLHQIPNPDKSDYGYGDFITSVDCTLMGNKTYQQVLGFDVEFPYMDMENYVVTRDRSLADDKYATYISENIAGFLSDLKNRPGKNIWCIGGGALIGLLLDYGLIDEIQLYMMPIILGAGIPLIHRLQEQCMLELLNTTPYKSGVIELRYKVILNN